MYKLYNCSDLFKFMFHLYGFLHVMRGQTLHPDLTQIHTSLQTWRQSCPAWPHKSLELVAETLQDDKHILLKISQHWKLILWHLSQWRDTSCLQITISYAQKHKESQKRCLYSGIETGWYEGAKHPWGSANKQNYENHVVKLIDVISSIDSANHDIIVMPCLSPLDTTDLRDTDWSLLMTQFLDSIWFLHKSGITHLNLKPGNVLVKYNNSLVPHLSIIEFDMSIHVNDDETPITAFAELWQRYKWEGKEALQWCIVWSRLTSGLVGWCFSIFVLTPPCSVMCTRNFLIQIQKGSLPWTSWSRCFRRFLVGLSITGRVISMDISHLQLQA